MATHPHYTGVTQILDAFDTMYQPGYTYSILDTNREIIGQWPYEDREKGAQFFGDMIKATEQSDNDNLFYVVFHPPVKKDHFIDKKTPIISKIPIRVCQLPDTGDKFGNFVRREVNGERTSTLMLAVNELPNKITGLVDERMKLVEARLAAIETAEHEPEEQTVMGQIGQLIMTQPGIVEQIPALIGAGIELLKSFIPKRETMGTTINGTTENKPVEVKPINEAVLNNALERLSLHCEIDNDLLRLAEMAEKNPTTFNFLLSQLRSK